MITLPPLPWNSAQHYWFCLWLDKPPVKPLHEALTKIPGMHHEASFYFLSTPKQWIDSWKELKNAIRQYGPPAGLHLALVPGVDKPLPDMITPLEKSVSELEALANHLWLGDALLEGQLGLAWQNIVDGKGQILGQEAFARLYKGDDTIDGARIFQAAKAMQIEAELDKELCALAFTESKNHSGKLTFINLLPAYILQPKLAVAQLSKLVEQLDLSPNRIVLDIPPTGIHHDPMALQRSLPLFKEAGFLTALDDIRTAQGISALLAKNTPDFLKLDRSLSQLAHHRDKAGEIQEILACGLPVIAEAVETPEQKTTLAALGVLYFQGFLF